MNPDLIWTIIAISFLLHIVAFAMLIKLARLSSEAVKVIKEIDDSNVRAWNAIAQTAQGIGDMTEWADRVEKELEGHTRRLDLQLNRIEMLEVANQPTAVTVTPSGRKSRATKKALGEVADAVKQQIDQEVKKLDDSEKT